MWTILKLFSTLWGIFSFLRPLLIGIQNPLECWPFQRLIWFILGLFRLSRVWFGPCRPTGGLIWTILRLLSTLWGHFTLLRPLLWDTKPIRILVEWQFVPMPGTSQAYKSIWSMVATQYRLCVARLSHNWQAKFWCHLPAIFLHYGFLRMDRRLLINAI